MRHTPAIISHQIPAEPSILAGQMSTTDPTRSPPGTQAFWAYTHVPQQAKMTQGPDGLTGRRNHDEIGRMADRIQRRIQEHAPDFSSKIISRRILGPMASWKTAPRIRSTECSRGTSRSLHQQLIFLLVPGLSLLDTPIVVCSSVGVSASPGGGGMVCAGPVPPPARPLPRPVLGGHQGYARKRDN